MDCEPVGMHKKKVIDMVLIRDILGRFCETTFVKELTFPPYRRMIPTVRMRVIP